MKVTRSDAADLAYQFDKFLELVEDPDKYFKDHNKMLPESRDMKALAAALFLLGDCYLRGRGLNLNPRSKTSGMAVEGLASM